MTKDKTYCKPEKCYRMNEKIMDISPRSVSFPEEEFLPHPVYDRFIVGNFGTILDSRCMNLAILPIIGYTGKPTIQLMNSEGGTMSIGDQFDVSQLVMETFCPNTKKGKFYIRHLDGDVCHNVYDPGKPWHNLEWAPLEPYEADPEIRKAPPEYWLNLFNISEDLLRDICSLMERGYTNSEVIESIGMVYDQTTIRLMYQIRSGSVRPEISSQYNIPVRTKVTYTDEQYRFICELIRNRYSNIDIVYICQQNGIDISEPFVSCIRRGKVQKANKYLQGVV